MSRFFKIISTSNAKKSAFYYFGNFLLNIGRYFFHLVLLRFLVPSQYGEFLSYLSLTYLLSIPINTMGNVVVKSVSEFYGRDESISLNHFFYFILRKTLPITILSSLIFIALANPLAQIFKAQPLAFIVLGISLVISLFQTLIGSYLSGLHRFTLLTFTGYLSVILSIAFSIIFILMGLGATGAVIGQLSSGVVITTITFFSLKKTVYPPLPGQEKFMIDLKRFTGYSFLYSLGTLSLISTDVLIVRYLFDPFTSGLYSSLSILGRMIFYGLSPLTALALPVATHRFAKRGNAQSVFFKLGGVLLLFGLVGAGIFGLFPSFIIRLFSGQQYLAVAPYLSIFAFTMVLFAINQFVISYLMATDRPQANLGLLLATLAQPLAFIIYRHSLWGVVWSNFSIQLVLLAILSFFFLKQPPRSHAKV